MSNNVEVMDKLVVDGYDVKVLYVYFICDYICVKITEITFNHTE